MMRFTDKTSWFPYLNDVVELKYSCAFLGQQYLGRGALVADSSIALDFDVTEFFVFGSSLGNVLAYRKIRVRNNFDSSINIWYIVVNNVILKTLITNINFDL